MFNVVAMDVTDAEALASREFVRQDILFADR
jgi:hypothetical protein